ncbi:MAG: AraC family transcriptional regulator [Proteobacteria bacterium]|nr:MAG: AraC family transcriptional regulator [Pseudomonadota bacterium]
MPAKPSTSGAPPLFHFSTDAFSQRERITAWRELVGRSIVNVDIEPLDAGRLRADASACLLPGLGLIFAYSDAHRCNHPRELIKNDDLSFMAASALRWTASQLGRHPTLGPGEGVLMSNADVGSMTLSDSRFVAFSVPRAAIAGLVPDVGAAIARPIPANNPAFKLLQGYLATANDVQGLVTPELQQLAVTHVYDLLALALGATRDVAATATGRGVRAARLAAAKAFVHRHLHRSDLRADSVAAHLGVTPRYVHMLFEPDGLSFLDYVRAERLALAYRALLDDTACSVSAVAFAAGFADLSHFNRTFRRRFGRTPTEVRGDARCESP